MDFTLNKYRELLLALKESGYTFSTVKDFRAGGAGKVVILRQDVDALPANAVAFARIQSEMGIASTFYFRCFQGEFEAPEIGTIAALGHEIGYHYETMDTCRGNSDKAYDAFCRNLEQLRRIIPVTTVCMHGSPLSRFDNRAIWEKYDYRSLGIVAEPYFDFDFNRLFYITDTGRRWDGHQVSLRDKPRGEVSTNWPVFRHTREILGAIHQQRFPEQVMMTFHPQRWTDHFGSWLRELLLQNAKNRIKKAILVRNH